MNDINTQGLVMIGCGFMGKAMLQGWLASGMRPEAVHVHDPSPSDWLLQQAGLHINKPLPESPAVLVLAVKPQLLDKVLPDVAPFGGADTLVLSVVTGVPFTVYEDTFNGDTPIVRVMPNLPSAVGAGTSVYVCNEHVDSARERIAKELLETVGVAIRLEDEEQIHPVTGVSGSGPAYVFAMAEAMAKAGESMGLSPELSMALAVHTIAGAGQMMRDLDTPPADLRTAVTSKGGTTAEALKVLMAADTGLFDLMEKACQASCDRSVVLGKQPSG